MDKANYIVLTPIEYDHVRYEVNNTIYLDEKTAKPLIAVNAIDPEPVDGEPAVPVDLAQRAVLIAEAIGKLDSEKPENWLKNGQPDLAALTELLGWQPSASERNTVWDEIQSKAK